MDSRTSTCRNISAKFKKNVRNMNVGAAFSTNVSTVDRYRIYSTFHRNLSKNKSACLLKVSKLTVFFHDVNTVSPGTAGVLT